MWCYTNQTQLPQITATVCILACNTDNMELGLHLFKCSLSKMTAHNYLRTSTLCSLKQPPFGTFARRWSPMVPNYTECQRVKEVKDRLVICSPLQGLVFLFEN
ncbi:hypothetical protein XELAEV_18044735mg [Xenopus laevis]|uniref:Uncharacterized protein n=1 Tax=Xenopus laevis TaxID=8355 RepID=A0A974BZC3_XENLA|nr:hypothetical protein XELAEV_18044735mg [Xenopus laevis]